MAYLIILPFMLIAGLAIDFTDLSATSNSSAEQGISSDAAAISVATVPRDLSPVEANRARADDSPIPDVLSSEDAERYRQIFSLQHIGKWEQADILIDQLDDPVLLGHVQAQKYLHPTLYRSKYAELLKWMEDHADYPQAKRIYSLAKKRRISGWKSPPPPQVKMLIGSGGDVSFARSKPYVSPRKRSDAAKREIVNLRRDIYRRIRKGDPDQAMSLLSSDRTRTLLDPVEFAIERARIAHAFFIFGEDENALTLARKSVAEAPRSIPVAAWTGGLAAWRLGSYDESLEMFGILAKWIEAPPELRAAAAFWASRAQRATGQAPGADAWLSQAATVPGSFYGLLARSNLDVEESLDWSLPPLTQLQIDQILEHPSGWRAFALLQVGRYEEADLELRILFLKIPKDLRASVMTIAARHGVAGLAMRVAGLLYSQGHRPYYAALFPIPFWTENIAEEGGDAALILAVSRQESKFDPNAKSRRGARGLMQLMPRTAAYVGEDKSLRNRSGKRTLFDPEINLRLGGQYIRYLMDHQVVDGDLLKMLAAYNAGPGTLGKWSREVDYKKDPLFFIEAVPSRETRDYIEHVLLNLWMYRLHLGQGTPSLDQVASGAWPGDLKGSENVGN